MQENYGADIKNSANPFAIPYRAVNSPTPYIFANFLEAYNYTAQMIYCDGIKPALFTSLLRSWQNQARLERASDPTAMSATERKFNYIFNSDQANVSILDLECNDRTLMDALHAKYGRHPVLVQQVVREVLSTLTIDEAILRSDTLNLVAMFDKAIAFSATPENHRTFHPKVNMVYETSFLIESQVMDYLHEKQTPITVIATPTANGDQSARDFLHSVITMNKDLSVILDCGGRLRGLSNLDVVKQLAKSSALKNKKYILFFQGSDLYAWSVNAQDNQIPIKLSSTDPDVIQAELDGCTPDKRFTFLDQEHTLGVDIRQSKDACAVVTVDIKTTLSAFLQAVMRMRDLENNQHVVITIDPTVASLMPPDSKSTSESLEHLFKIMENNQTSQLETDHFCAAIKKIRNLFREDLDNRILSEDNTDSRDRAYLVYEPFFIDIQTDDIVALYKQKAKLLKTSDIFSSCANDYMNQWMTCLQSAGVSQDEINQAKTTLTIALNDICKKSTKVCTALNIFPPFQGNREMQQQTQQLKQAQKKLESKKLDERKKPEFTVLGIELSWIEQFFATTEKTNYIKSRHQSIKSVTSKMNKNGWDFNDNIFASSHLLYAYTDQERNDIYNPYTKIPTAILYITTDTAIQAVLVYAEEAEALKIAIMKNNCADRIWLSTLNGAALTAMPELNPDLKKQHQILLEQACLFYGRADFIFSFPTIEWIAENVEAKIDFLNQHVKPALGLHEDQVDRLSSRFNKLDAFIQLWAKYPPASAVVDDFVAHATQSTRKRIDIVLPFLTNIRQNNQVFTIEKLVETMPLNDALLIDEYQNTFAILTALKDKHFSDAASRFMRHHHKLPLGIMCYGLPNNPVTLDESEIKQIAEILTDNNIKSAWIRQICMSPTCVAALSQECFSDYMAYIRPKDLCFYLKNIVKENSQRVTLMNKYLALPSVADESFMSVAAMKDDFDDTFTEEALKSEGCLAALIHLDHHDIKNESLVVRVRETNHRQVIFFLNQRNLLTSTNLNSDLTNTILTLKDLNVSDNALIMNVINHPASHLLIERMRAKYPIKQDDLLNIISLSDICSEHGITHDHLFDLIAAYSDDINLTNQALVLLKGHNLLNTENISKLLNLRCWQAIIAKIDAHELKASELSQALNDPEYALALTVLNDNKLPTTDPTFKMNSPSENCIPATVLACHYQRHTKHIATDTSEGIKALIAVRNKLQANKLYSKEATALDLFTQEMVVTLLAADKLPRTIDTEKHIISSLNKSAHKHFKQRYQVLKIIADVLLALTGVGFFVFTARKIAGKSFFFSQAKTKRQAEFENDLGKVRKWNPKLIRRHS